MAKEYTAHYFLQDALAFFFARCKTDLQKQESNVNEQEMYKRISDERRHARYWEREHALTLLEIIDLESDPKATLNRAIEIAKSAFGSDLDVERDHYRAPIQGGVV
jgi:hypothetical protein